MDSLILAHAMPWIHSSLHTQCHGFPHPCTHNAMDSLILAHAMPWIPSSLHTQCHGFPHPCTRNAMDSLILAHTMPWIPSSLHTQCHGFSHPCTHNAMDSLILAHTMLWIPSSLHTQCHGFPHPCTHNAWLRSCTLGVPPVPPAPSIALAWIQHHTCIVPASHPHPPRACLAWCRPLAAAPGQTQRQALLQLLADMAAGINYKHDPHQVSPERVRASTISVAHPRQYPRDFPHHDGTPASMKLEHSMLRDGTVAHPSHDKTIGTLNKERQSLPSDG